MKRNHSLYIGIDPGAEGSIAVLLNGTIERTQVLDSEPLGVYTKVTSLMEWVRSTDLRFRVCVERVGGYHKGSGGNIGSAMFNFGKAYGSLLTALYANNVLGFLNPTATVWQRKVGAPQGNGDQEQHKRDLKAYASKIFPDQSPTLKTCDAMLIAYYASFF